MNVTTTRGPLWDKAFLWITVDLRLIPTIGTVLPICIRTQSIHVITAHCIMTILIRHADHLCIAAAIRITSMAMCRPISMLQ